MFYRETFCVSVGNLTHKTNVMEDLYVKCQPPLGYSPSWMRTLMRRTAPPLALAKNCRNSGVTTSARNMAAQQRFPPAGRRLMAG